MTMRQRRVGARERQDHQQRGFRSGLRGRIPFPLFLLAVCAAVTVGATAIRALKAGDHAHQVFSGTAERLLAFLDYFAGVFTLLSLTAAVLCGLAATDRLVLTPRLRVAAQSVHRATSVAAVGFLATHIGVKIAEREANPLVALLPFGGGATFAVGLGTIAADLLVLAAATGAVRGRFADSRRPWLWRVLHASAYACWPIALAHGLTAGRAAAVWVLWSYGIAAALVALALLVRGLGLLERRPDLARLRGYSARRPSRADLADLAAQAREREPLPDATRTTTMPAAAPAAPTVAAAAAAPMPAAAAVPDQAREHPRLADTPPHGMPLYANSGAATGQQAAVPAAAPAGWAAQQQPMAAAAMDPWGLGGTAQPWPEAARSHAEGVPAGAWNPAQAAAYGYAPAAPWAGPGREMPPSWGPDATGQHAATAPTGWEPAQAAGPAGPYAATAPQGPWTPYAGQTPGSYTQYGWQMPWPRAAEPAGPQAATAPTGWEPNWQQAPAAGPAAPGWTSVEASGDWGPLTWDTPTTGSPV